MNWLKSMGATSWVRYDITDTKEVELAADWFMEQMEKFNKFLLQQEIDANYTAWVEADENGRYLTDGHTKAYPCDHAECDLKFINQSRTMCSGYCAGQESQPAFITVYDQAEEDAMQSLAERSYDGTLADQVIPEDHTPDAFGD